MNVITFILVTSYICLFTYKLLIISFKKEKENIDLVLFKASVS